VIRVKGFSKTGFVAGTPNHRFNLKALIDFFKLMALNPLGLYPFDDKYKWFCIKNISETSTKIWSSSKEIKTCQKRSVQVSFGP
tara:strand:+ start:194 stop:445 length:252 start_codon:yes stop_codon:yes gene_type:complete